MAKFHVQMIYDLEDIVNSSSCAGTHDDVLTFECNEFVKIIIDYLKNGTWLERNKKFWNCVWKTTFLEGIIF